MLAALDTRQTKTYQSTGLSDNPVRLHNQQGLGGDDRESEME
jgi:hypothetical protein